MPKLRCSASSCAHNQEECCCRGKINVAGEAASTSNETCCDNFFEDAGNARDAVSQEPMENIDIDVKHKTVCIIKVVSAMQIMWM